MNASPGHSMLVRTGCLRLALAVFLVALPGCLIIPTPQFDSGETRRNLRPDTPAQFQPGKTTRTEVLLALGEPDATSADERKLAYRSEKIAAIVLAGGPGAGAAAPLTKDEYLVCEFDARGRLVTAERSTHWLDSADVTRKVGPPAAAGPSAADVRINTRAEWLAGVDDYRTQGFTGAQWLPGQLILTDSQLRFFSRSDFGNAPPAFALPYRDLTSVAEDRFFLGRLLAIQTRTGKHYALRIWAAKKWTTDTAKLHEVLAFLNTRMARRGPGRD